MLGGRKREQMDQHWCELRQPQAVSSYWGSSHTARSHDCRAPATPAPAVSHSGQRADLQNCLGRDEGKHHYRTVALAVPRPGTLPGEPVTHEHNLPLAVGAGYRQTSCSGF